MFDAHNHLQDPLFDGTRESVIADMKRVGISRCVVNGTHPNDWDLVADLAKQHPNFIVPSFGLHPWYATSETLHSPWLNKLSQFLSEFHHTPNTPNVAIGECGLDRSQRHKQNIAQQTNAFIAQLDLATQQNLPLTIHCVQAWGLLLEILESHPLPERGFLLHSYSGSAELIPRLTKLGAYFSFSGNILHPQKHKLRNAFLNISPDRLLAETDAPNMLPPEANTLPHTQTLPPAINHPANLKHIISSASTFLDTSQLSNNFHRFFG